MATALMLAGALPGRARAELAVQQIEMIIAFPAGSGVDVIGRALAPRSRSRSGRMSSCSTATAPPARSASRTLAAAAPDGHTIAFGPTTPIANAPYLVKGVRYNVESFSYICQVFENVFTVAVGPQSKIKSVQELLAAAKEILAS